MRRILASFGKGAMLGMALNQMISLGMSYLLGLGYYAPCLAGLGEVVRDGFTVSRDAVGSSGEDVIAWLRGLGYARE